MKLFSEVKNKEELKEVLLNADEYNKGAYNPDIIEQGFNSINELDSLKESYLVSFGDKIDKYFGLGNDKLVIRNKLSTTFATAILIDKCYDGISNLDEKEFLTLAFYLSYVDPNLFDQYVLLCNKKVLNSLCTRFDDYMDREYIMEYLGDKIDSQEVDKLFDVVSTVDVSEARKMHEIEIENFGKGIL